MSDVTKAVINANLPNAEVNACTTVVNATKCKMYMKNFGEFFNDQVANAGCIVLSHSENCSEDKLAETVALLRGQNKTAEIVTTPLSEISGMQILSAMEHTATLVDELEKLKEQASHHSHHHDHEHEHHHEHEDGECCCGHHHEHEHEHHHEHEDGECCCGHHHDHEHEHHHHADEVFQSWGKETSKKFAKCEIEEILKKLDSCEKYGAILRAKGIVAGEGEWIHFDFIPGGIDVRSGGAETTGRLCVIGCDLDENALSELFSI